MKRKWKLFTNSVGFLFNSIKIALRKKKEVFPVVLIFFDESVEAKWIEYWYWWLNWIELFVIELNSVRFTLILLFLLFIIDEGISMEWAGNRLNIMDKQITIGSSMLFFNINKERNNRIESSRLWFNINEK